MDSDDQIWSAPRDNPDLIGHEDAEQVLLEAWQNQRMPHAWLISGPKGVGKATLAFRFARFVLAEQTPQRSDLFGQQPVTSLFVAPDSPVFMRVSSGSDRNLVTIERSVDEKNKKLRSEIVVQDIRRLASFFSLTAAEKGWRIVVIDAADEMNRNAANAVLKMIEEPPPSSLILLVSHTSGRILPTIRSRCRHLRLRPLRAGQVTEIVGMHMPDLTENDCLTAAIIGEGSPGRALALAERGGVEIYRLMIDILSKKKDSLAEVHALGDQLGRKEEGDSYRTFMDLLSWWLSRVIRYRAIGQFPPSLVAGDEAAASQIGGMLSLDRLADLWEKIGRLVERADHLNLSHKQVILNVFHAIRLAR